MGTWIILNAEFCGRGAQKALWEREHGDHPEAAAKYAISVMNL